MPFESSGMLFGFGLFVLGTVVLVVVIWQLFVTYRARAGAAREQEYRRLAEATQEQLRENNRQLGELNNQLTELEQRLGRLERILSSVE